jgi:RNA recognition motif-containing protein
MPSQIPSPSVSNSELQSLENEQISNSSYHHSQQQHHQNHHHHRHYYQHYSNTSMNDSQHTSKTNLYIRGLSPDTTDNDLHEMCKK